MPNSIRHARVEKWRQWKKRHPDWPLSVGSNGQWQKKVRGVKRCFGTLDDPDGALAEWLFKKDYYLAGEEPPKCTSDKTTVASLCEKFRTDVEVRRDSAEISTTYARDLLFAAAFVEKHMVRSRPVESLQPDHFAALRQAVTATGRGLRGQKNLMADIRTMFLWGGDTPGKGMGYYPNVDFGPRFQPPSSDALAKEREASGSTRFIEREDLLALLEHAKPAMKCMILLGINCGFYASDSIALTFDRLHLSHRTPHHDFYRMKNGRRRVGVLWPETVNALVTYIERHRGDSDSDRVILNQYGRPHSDAAVGRGIRTAFMNLAKKAKVTLPPCTSIGSLRHTYGTVVDLAPDQQMIDLSMGHAPKGMQKRIYSQLNLGELDRLAAVADVVHRWLYKGELAGVPGREGNAYSGPASVPFRIVG
jgi:integrase